MAAHIEMSSDPEFGQTVRRIFSEYAVEEIIETGTYLGTGSTGIFAGTGVPVITIECNPVIFQKARENLKDYVNVRQLNGFSLSRAEMIRFIKEDDIYDNNPGLKYEGADNPKLFYFREIDHQVQENLLPPLIRNTKCQLIFLDSAGGTGFAEYKRVIRMPKHYLSRKLLMMDDVDHVKHYRSAQDLIARGYNFHYSSSGRWGWADLSANADK